MSQANTTQAVGEKVTQSALSAFVLKQTTIKRLSLVFIETHIATITIRQESST